MELHSGRAGEFPAARIITLTTDFGLSDGFVGIMKGVLLARASRSRLVDLTHDITPQDILEGALVLERAIDYFSEGTVHLAVVDPGVGSHRRAIAVDAGSAFFVGPDNGLFTLALANREIITAVSIENHAVMLPEISATFQGRDVFAPAAAFLANGGATADLGPPAANLVKLQIPQPIVKPDRLESVILTADRFGNLISNINWRVFDGWRGHRDPESFRVTLADREVGNIRRTFSDVMAGEPVAYFGSGGRLEVGIRNGKAARSFAAERGTRIEVRRA